MRDGDEDGEERGDTEKWGDRKGKRRDGYYGDREMIRRQTEKEKEKKGGGEGEESERSRRGWGERRKILRSHSDGRISVIRDSHNTFPSRVATRPGSGSGVHLWE